MAKLEQLFPLLRSGLESFHSQVIGAMAAGGS
jgi:hypothetical protein